MIAFPAEVQESSVLAALARVNIDDAIGASSALVPLSNFSRIIAVTYQNASQRALPGDPRRTPFLDELGRRFSVSGPDDAPWTVIYLPGPSRNRDESAARALTGLSPDWAWDEAGRAGSSRWFLLPPLLWAVWLVFRNPRRERFQRVAWVLSFLPLLIGARPGGSLLFMALTAGGTLATRYAHSGVVTRLPFMVFPLVGAVIVALMYEPASLPFFIVSIALAGISAYLRPMFERLVNRKRMHGPPEFSNLTIQAVQDFTRRIARVLAIPVSLTMLITAFAPASEAAALADAPRFRIERASMREREAGHTLYEDHLAFQRAITYGRLGDFSLEDTSYVPAYRYREEDGRMRRTDDAADSMSDWPASTFKAAVKVLSYDGPGAILPK